MLEKYLQLLKDEGADLAIVIDPATIVTAPWTRFKCQYGCAMYGQKPCCPPRTPTWKETRDVIGCYSLAILFRCHQEGAATPIARTVARELFFDDYYKVLPLGSGPCQRCAECQPERCRFQGGENQAIPAMEACGIDVFATVRANGLDIHTLRDFHTQEQDHFGLLLVE